MGHRWGTAAAAGLALALAAAGWQAVDQVGEQPDGSALVPTNQRVAPAGLVRRIDGARPKDMALSPDGSALAVLTTEEVMLFTAAGEPGPRVRVNASALGIAWSPEGRILYASSESGRICRIQREGAGLRLEGQHEVDVEAGQRGTRQNPQPLGLAVSPDGTRLYVALGVRNAVVAVDTRTMKVASAAKVGVAPYALLLSRDGSALYAACRGGRPPAAGDAAAESAGTRTRVDRETDASRGGAVYRLEAPSLRGATSADTGRQPSAMALSPDGRTLAVACSDSDSLVFHDPVSLKARGTLPLAPPDDRGFGQIPTALAYAEDGGTLFVACGGANAVAVVRLKGHPRIAGWIPSGWYPVALSARNGRLHVASAKGVGARSRRTGGRNSHDNTGTLQVLEPSDLADLGSLTRGVARNNSWARRPSEGPARRAARPRPIPERVGEPSVFRHVVYIIKENHTYDMTLGDLPQGNGDPSLCTFPEEVTPNQHALAREWVLLDNTYTSGTNSADGHQWAASSVANDYVERNYSAHVRSYPYDGGDPLAYSPAGFLWTAARRRGLSVRVYGEFVNEPRIVDTRGGRPTWQALWQDYRQGGNRFQITAHTDQEALRPLLHPRFIGFPMTVSDQWRADQFLEDLDRFQREGGLPNLSILLLPNNHTAGTNPSMPTPRALVADNDLALGRIVDRISHSRFWSETLILVIEDDSQLGLDHVDGHRTLAYCISPYTRRGVVVSTPYNHTSFVRTMGLVLGFPPLNRFDRTATPLTDCFMDTPDLRPFVHRPARVRLDEMNPPARLLRGEARRLAEACARLDWSDVDRAHAETVSRAVWASTRPGQPFPRYAFHPPDRDE